MDDKGEILPPWHGDRQRAALRGFARFKAVLWRRSLWLYQGWKLWREPWYRSLVQGLGRASASLDLFASARVQAQGDVFGETPILTLRHLLAVAESHLPSCPSTFVDLGCGRGATCLTAACLGWQALGFEKETTWVEAARRVAASLEEAGLASEARFEAGDFLQAEWPDEALFLVVATAYPSEMRDEIALRLSGQGQGTAVLTADWELPEEQFVLRWRGTLPVEWGLACFALWSLQPDLKAEAGGP